MFGVTANDEGVSDDGPVEGLVKDDGMHDGFELVGLEGLEKGVDEEVDVALGRSFREGGEDQGEDREVGVARGARLRPPIGLWLHKDLVDVGVEQDASTAPLFANFRSQTAHVFIAKKNRVPGTQKISKVKTEICALAAVAVTAERSDGKQHV